MREMNIIVEGRTAKAMIAARLIEFERKPKE
jgi:hypothetical protein